MNGMEMARVAPEVEVTAKASRRRFTVAYKRKIVREADGCKTPGAVGVLLRREGLYSSHLTAWRRAARDRGKLAGAPKKRGPAPQVADPRDKKIAELERETTRWRKCAERADLRGARGAPGHLLPASLAPGSPAAVWAPAPSA